MDDNKRYNIKIPDDDFEMKSKFLRTIDEIINFDIRTFKQENIEKCRHCIYEPACAYSLVDVEECDD